MDSCPAVLGGCYPGRLACRREGAALLLSGWLAGSYRAAEAPPVPWERVAPPPERLGADVNQSPEAAWSTLQMGGRGLAESPAGQGEGARWSWAACVPSVWCGRHV